MTKRPTWEFKPFKDALAFLHDMLTQDMRDLAAGEVRVAALLTDKGRVRAVVRVMRDGDVYLDADAAATDAVEQGLVRIAPLAGVEAAQSPKVIPAITEAARIRTGIPAFGIDIDESTLFNETPLIAIGASFTKGCYPGQESVARIHNLGSVKRTLSILRVDGPPPSPGTAVKLSGGHAGVVTSSAHDDDGTVAFAMLEGSAAAAGDLVIDGSPATVTAPAP